MSTAVSEREDRPGTSHLQHGAVGLLGALFQSITHMAPAVAVAFYLAVCVPYSGGSIPLSVLLALIACLCVAVSIGQLARYLPSAGGLYPYNSNGLGPIVGFLVGWAFMLSEPIVAPLLYLIFGSLVAGTMQTYWKTPYSLWAVWVIVAGAVVWYLVYEGIRLSTKVGILLGLFEVAVFLALAVTLVIKAGGHNTLAVFGPNTGNSKGWGSVFPGMIYAVLAFIGFEASAPLGEEAQSPRRTVPRAIILSCLLLGLLYVFAYYAASVYFGPGKMAGSFVSFNVGDPWTGMAKRVWDWGWILVFLAVAGSAIANSNAGANAATRVGYSLARTGLLPGALAAIHPRRRTPYIAVHVQSLGGIALALFLGWITGSPLKALALLGTIITIVMVAIYILTNLSCFAYYWRFQRLEFNPLLHLVIPAVGIMFFLPAEVAAIGLNLGGLGIARLEAPSDKAPLVILVWMAVGLALLLYFLNTDPDRIAETGDVFLEDVTYG